MWTKRGFHPWYLISPPETKFGNQSCMLTHLYRRAYLLIKSLTQNYQELKLFFFFSFFLLFLFIYFYFLKYGYNGDYRIRDRLRFWKPNQRGFASLPAAIRYILTDEEVVILRPELSPQPQKGFCNLDIVQGCKNPYQYENHDVKAQSVKRGFLKRW